jgi:hypothetical protein
MVVLSKNNGKVAGVGAIIAIADKKVIYMSSGCKVRPGKELNEV